MKDNKINDNPNPRAYIGILCSYTFFYFAYKSVYENLDHVEFILDFSSAPGKSSGFEFPEWYKQNVRKFFSRQGVHWRDYDNSELKTGEFFSKYNTLIAGYHSLALAHPCNEQKKKVRIFYSTAKDSWVFSLTNAYFDLVLCPSDFYTQKMNRLYGLIAKTTGEPKLDALKEALAGNFLSENGIKLDSHKPTLIYAPTWGVLSSEEMVFPQLLQLLPDYNVIYKPHHVSVLLRKDFFDDLRRSSTIQIASEDVSLLELLKLDATVLSDNSGAMFDALHAGRPLILIDTLADSPEGIFTETPFFTFRSGKFGGASTTMDSLEQIVKREGSEIAPVIRVHQKGVWREGSLKQAIVAAVRLASDGMYRVRQQDLKEKFLENPDGRAGIRSAQAVRELIESGNVAKSEIREYVSEFKMQINNTTEARIMAECRPSLVSVEDEIARIRRLPYLERIKVVSELFF